MKMTMIHDHKQWYTDILYLLLILWIHKFIHHIKYSTSNYCLVILHFDNRKVIQCYLLLIYIIIWYIHVYVLNNFYKRACRYTIRSNHWIHVFKCLFSYFLLNRVIIICTIWIMDSTNKHYEINMYLWLYSFWILITEKLNRLHPFNIEVW